MCTETKRLCKSADVIVIRLLFFRLPGPEGDHVDQFKYLSRFPPTSPKMVESKPNDFFPKIGEVAEKTDALADKDLLERTNEEDEDRPVEEVESLCMSCGEQVRDRVGLARDFAQLFGLSCVGCYEIAVDNDPVLQGGDHYVVQV